MRCGVLRILDLQLNYAKRDVERGLVERTRGVQVSDNLLGSVLR